MEKNVENSQNKVNIVCNHQNDKNKYNLLNTKLIQLKNDISNKSNVILLVNSIVSIVLFILVCFNLWEINKMKNELHLLKLNNSKLINIYSKLSNEIDDIDLLNSNEYFKVLIFVILRYIC